MVIAGRIQRYIFVQCLLSLAMTLGIILLAILLVDVVEQVRTVGARTEIGIETAFKLTLMKTPGLLLETLPFAMLVGSILTYSQLSRRSEIPAVRAAGVSAWRFLGPVMVLAVVVGASMDGVGIPGAGSRTLRCESALPPTSRRGVDSSRSPARAGRPGSSRWPGLRRQKVTVSQAAGAEPSTAPLAPSTPEGTSIATTVWDDRAAMHHAHLAEGFHAQQARGHGLAALDRALQIAGPRGHVFAGQVDRPARSAQHVPTGGHLPRPVGGVRATEPGLVRPRPRRGRGALRAAAAPVRLPDPARRCAAGGAPAARGHRRVTRGC